MLELLSTHACHGGGQRFYRHASQVIGLPMNFSVYLPPQAAHGRVPALFYLGGLTCTDESFAIKTGAQRAAAQHGIALVAPDTSPRGTGAPGETDARDLGARAGFYVEATEAPWSTHYRMYSYVVDDLREAACAELPIDDKRLGIFGHSMGGHGALVLALRNPAVFRSVSAFAPIAAPARGPWGEKAFGAYLGEARDAWKQYDASEPVARPDAVKFREAILVDQGARGSVPGYAALSRCLRSRLSRGRTAADPASARGIRPRLFFHTNLHGRSHRAPRRGTQALSATGMDSAISN